MKYFGLKLEVLIKINNIEIMFQKYVIFYIYYVLKVCFDVRACNRFIV